MWGWLGKAKNLTLGVILSQAEANNAGEGAAEEEEGNFLVAQVTGQNEESGEVAAEVKMESSLEAESAEETEDEDGSF